MNKLMSSLVAAAVIGAFSLPALAAGTPSTMAATEKPAAAPKKVKKAQHAQKADKTKTENRGGPATK